jgi:hypothetical protein
MQAVVGHAARNKRDLVVLQSGIGKKTVCEIYNAVRNKSDETIVRAGSDRQGNNYVYMPKQESWFAVAYKGSSIRNHRQSMVDLLNKAGGALQSEVWLDKKDRLCLMKLSYLCLKDIRQQDFKAGELKSHLKPLSNSVHARDRWVNKANLNEKFSPIPKTFRDYYKQFLNKTSADNVILRNALFGNKNSRISLKEERVIIKSLYILLHTYLNQGVKKQPLERLIQQSPQKDLLLQFANAWLNHVQKSGKFSTPNLLQTFSWHKAITEVAKCIQKHAQTADTMQTSFTPVSPERALGITRMLGRSDPADDLESPFKPKSVTKGTGLASLEADKKQHAPEIILDNSIGSEIEVTSLTEEEISSDDTSLSDGRRLMHETEGAYTIFADASVSDVGEANADLPKEQ